MRKFPFPRIHGPDYDLCIRSIDASISVHGSIRGTVGLRERVVGPRHLLHALKNHSKNAGNGSKEILFLAKFPAEACPWTSLEHGRLVSASPRISKPVHLWMQMIALSFIAAFIDIQKVIDDVDLSVLEENLANISLCNIEEEMVRSRCVSIPRE